MLGTTRILIGILLVGLWVGGTAQGNEADPEKQAGKKSPYYPYEFRLLHEIPHSQVKSQDKTGTCWAFAAVSFLESEHLRQFGKTLDLSEIFIARHVYPKKAEVYIRRNGHANFWEGSLIHDALWAIGQYGIVPESAYPGRRHEDGRHDHREMAAVLKAMLDAVLERPARKLSDCWPSGFDGLLDAYLGKPPESLEFDGRTMSPVEFRDRIVRLDLSEYVQLTSFTHHPFYVPFQLEIPDNWSGSRPFYNVPLDELEEAVDHAVNNGYSVAWDGDVSERSAAKKRRGFAVIPEDRQVSLKEIEEPVTEKEVHQRQRQQTFDNAQTTEDHVMHLIGIAEDQTGAKFYLVKDSWFTRTDYEGRIYLSRPYFRLKTIAVMMHKDALPKLIRNKLGF